LENLLEETSRQAQRNIAQVGEDFGKPVKILNDKHPLIEQKAAGIKKVVVSLWQNKIPK
jgi:hypothetical protein